MDKNTATSMVTAHPTHFSYNGMLSEEVVQHIFETLENSIFLQESKPVRRKILLTVIELLQNMLNYYTKNNLKNTPVDILVEDNSSEVLIKVENQVLVRSKPNLKMLLMTLKNLSKDAAKDRIRAKRFQSDMCSGSAGTGLLEVVSHTGGKINYSFKYKSKEICVFKIQANITKT